MDALSRGLRHVTCACKFSVLFFSKRYLDSGRVRRRMPPRSGMEQLPESVRVQIARSLNSRDRCAARWHPLSLFSAPVTSCVFVALFMQFRESAPGLDRATFRQHTLLHQW